MMDEEMAGGDRELLVVIQPVVNDGINFLFWVVMIVCEE